MSKPSPTAWYQRKSQIQTLLGCNGNDEEEGIALDRLLHGQAVIGKTQKSSQLDKLRFSDKDLDSFGQLAEAQFGQVELTERHILLLALKSGIPSSTKVVDPVVWTPRILCAYQCSSFLNIVMEYAAGGSLWDVLESSGTGRLMSADLGWWAPQCVAALGWLHSHCGFAHRDVKPHNFVLRPDARLLLIDFGSAAPLLSPGPDGAQCIPREFCLVPCGTCDYISPEILQAHEEALVALEMSDNEDGGAGSDDEDFNMNNSRKGNINKKIVQDSTGYGRETDWWSLGAMLYELAFGVAPFFANDIRQTYSRIMHHETSLKFDRNVPVDATLVSLIKDLLTHHEVRLGRQSVNEIKSHAYFKDVNWTTLHKSRVACRSAPSDLLLPQFTYTTPLVPLPVEEENTENSADASKPFAFSALFQSSVSSRPTASPGLSYLQNTMSTPAFGRRSLSRSGNSGSGSAQKSIASFIGFSWGPPKYAFDDATRVVPAEPPSASPGLFSSKEPSVSADPSTHVHPLITPMRPTHSSSGVVPPSTVRVASVRRSAQARPVSDREAMRLLVDCVGMSARKRVLESGKKPKVLLPHFGIAPTPSDVAGVKGERAELGMGRPRAMSYSRSTPRSSAVRKELRFDDTTTQIIEMEPNASYTNTFSSNTNTGTGSSLSANVLSVSVPLQHMPCSGSDASMSSETEGPLSPSPSPRPGSAMSMLSMSRRSTTPTVSSANVIGAGLARSNSEPPELRIRPRASSVGENEQGLKFIKQSARNFATVTKGEAPRRARFADMLVQTPEAPRDRVPPTPHPRRNLPASIIESPEARPRSHGEKINVHPRIQRKRLNGRKNLDPLPVEEKSRRQGRNWSGSDSESTGNRKKRI
ncbi:hypothetical protein EW145_g4616 [Phellinidium pouzarii]|uniref:Protein kinase domain-containing protein n=1 Tax=Phellinidium pouzarii TaxID=167371 RepID=A0A4S4L4P3_9AGAM|nr:hypothetical protein EW145_g4616 [Phellinidium pouzarii]